ncbi:MAG TPA: formate acetyltransferase [Tepidimicrobium sp.]|nr:formate acetyltransferase [Tepidimicrobium sp.]
MAFFFNNFERYRKYLKTTDGWMNFSVGIRTEDNTVAQSIWFSEGKATVRNGVKGVSVQLVPMDIDVLKSIASLPPSEVMNLLLKNRMHTIGNMAYLQYFNFLISVLMKNKQIKQMRAQKEISNLGKNNAISANNKKLPKKEYLKAKESDPGVKFISEDQYLSKYSIEDFPRLKEFLDIHFTKRPEICIERPSILTKWFRENGFEEKNDGTPWEPILRQGHAYKYLMENKKPIIRQNDLIAGTTSTKEIGVIIYPDASASLIWGELLTIQDRPLNPYDIDKKDIEKLNSDILPYWAERNIREWVRNKYGNPKYQQLDERFAVNFLWKNVAISHTIIDYPKLLKLGLEGIIKEIKNELKNNPESDALKKDTLKAMILCCEGIIAYAENLSKEAKALADKETDIVRKKELNRLSKICMNVPRKPATTLDEAVNAIWILWVAVHMENTNAGFSLGRMDQWLQPYFESDMEKLESTEEREEYIHHAIELIGCFYMRCTDHLPMVPDIGNHLFGGSSSDQAITLGGVNEKGEDAVNDMTYIFLKVTEMLAIRDPNINARFYNGVNTEAYLRRLCEVNVNTAGTPSIHNDEQVINSMEEFHYPEEDVNDWAATGCVEPTISGKHLGHTNCMMFNMVAALEMALNNGHHPLMRWDLGPKTGEPEDLNSFEEFFEAFSKQLMYLGELSCKYNNILGEAHSVLRPTPMISAAIEGSIKKGRDVTLGGAKYNSSGIACIGLADITDSLMAIKKLVYDEKQYSLKEVCRAISNNFVGYEKMHSKMLTDAPRFGSGNEEAVAIANRVTSFVHDFFANQKNFRGGPYTVGFWSMSNHVAFGTLTGALPSGRLAYKPFTPGLTPAADASKSLLDNIRDVAQLIPGNMNNNIAFNVKVVPSASDSHEETVDHLYAYAKSYCNLGGMQVQFNVVSSETMRAAMANPDEYRDLMVRISGYNAYFVTLNRDMQLELIERAEYGL